MQFIEKAYIIYYKVIKLLERENIIMKKTRKIIMSLFAGICTVLLMVTSASATYYYTGKSFTNNEGGFFGIGSTKYNYKVYKDNNSWYAMFHYLDVCPAIYHSKGKGTTSLTYNCSKSYTGTSAYQFGASLGAKVEIPELVGLTAEVTGSQTKSYSYSVAASGSVGRTIPSNAKTGYYKMTICYNFNKYRLDKSEPGSSKFASYYPCLPKGSAYVAVLYSPSSSNSSYAKY